MLVKDLFENGEGTNPWSTEEVIKELEKALVEALKFVNSQEKPDKNSIPAGPDTTKFKSSRSNMVEIIDNLYVPGSRPYGSETQYVKAIKVGGAYDYQTVHKVVWNMLANVAKGFNAKQIGKDVSDPYIIETETGNIKVRNTHGTNWSSYGYTK